MVGGEREGGGVGSLMADKDSGKGTTVDEQFRLDELKFEFRSTFISLGKRIIFGFSRRFVQLRQVATF